MSLFSNYSKGKTDFDALATQFKSEASNKKDWNDPRFYYPERDKSGKAAVVIRFLPDINGIEFSRRIHHYLHGKNGWYIENCPKTIDVNADCPVCEAKNKNVSDSGGWDKQNEEQKKYSSDRSWKTEFVSNILILKDSRNPELEGHVKLFKYGKEIMMNYIEKAPIQEFDSDPDPFNPFNLESGRNFNLNIIKDEKKRTTYVKSTWGDVNDITPKIEKIEPMVMDIGELVAADKFKKYKDLKKRYERITGESLANSDGTVAKAPKKRTAAAEKTPEEDIAMDKDINDDVLEDFGDDDDASQYFNDM